MGAPFAVPIPLGPNSNLAEIPCCAQDPTALQHKGAGGAKLGSQQKGLH